MPVSISASASTVASATESKGSRPPGLLVVGKSCETLVKGDPARKWVVEEGDLLEVGVRGEIGVKCSS